MGKLGQWSFRRILLSRILLLSIPVLLAGEYVVYRKARASFLETARQNLTDSAVRKGMDIQALTEALQSNLLLAREQYATQVRQPGEIGAFLQQLQTQFPAWVDCLQVRNIQTGTVDSSTCGKQPIAPVTEQRGSNQEPIPGSLSQVRVAAASTVPIPSTGSDLPRQLNLVFRTPLAPLANQPESMLDVRASFHHPQRLQGPPLTGYFVVIDQNGLILSHPLADRVGQTIDQQGNRGILKVIMANAIAGKQDSLHLFEENGSEWLVGYSALQMPLSGQEKHQPWVILAVAPISDVLADLKGIQQVLIILTLGLIGASVLATLYIARDLATPLEQLGQYALQIGGHHAIPAAPKNFKIRELNQLADVLDSMVKRQEERAQELEYAWQEAEAANRLKSEFLATTSHELRTPLNGIIGSVRLVRDGCCDSWEESLEFLQQADDAAIHLLKIINDLLDISKIEAGTVELNLQPISIPDLCQQCLRMVQPGAEKKRISLSLEVTDSVEKMPLDERRVRQMVINLLSNAVKFTPEGGRVKLSSWIGYGYQLEKENRPDHSPINPHTPYLCLEVMDTGIGIPQEHWHLLFRPFQQIDSSLTRRHEGTGLGLALTKRLVELHGGTLSFDSVPGKGSNFRLWLPSPALRSDVDPASLAA